MTTEEFKAEILKANPQAVFIDQAFRLICTPTKVLSDRHGETGFAIEFHRKGGDKPIIIDPDPEGSAGTFGCASVTAITPKKKRLMTPQECAGKWICSKDNTVRSLIVAFRNNEINVSSVGSFFYPVSTWHRDEYQIADTPVSEPYSLEIEE